MTFLDPVLNPVFGSLLNSSPFLVILIMAFIISLIITLVYKLMTNQKEMKEMKEKQKEFQSRMKELKSNPEEMMKVQKEAMQVNMKYMKQSFKPTLVTMIPILLIFGWMTAHLSFEPIYPGEAYSITADFAKSVSGEVQLVADESTTILNEPKQTITGAVTWNLKSTEGEHAFTVKAGDQEQTKKVLITKELKYEDQISIYKHSDITSIKVNYDKLKPLGGFELFGWQPGWLGLYIIMSLVFSLSLRKFLKIY